MANSKTEISNMAISHLGTGKEIIDLDTEKSEEASVCRRFFEIAKDTVLQDCEWPFATKIASLGLIESSPNNEWDYSYSYPSDCLNFRKLQSGIRNDTRQSRIPYRIGHGDSGAIIFTDQEDAIGEYTVKITDTSRFYPDFTLALSLKLAYLIAPRLTKGDPDKMKQQIQSEYLYQLSLAKASAFNEEQMDEQVDSQFIRIRE